MNILKMGLLSATLTEVLAMQSRHKQMEVVEKASHRASMPSLTLKCQNLIHSFAPSSCTNCFCSSYSTQYTAAHLLDWDERTENQRGLLQPSSELALQFPCWPARSPSLHVSQPRPTSTAKKNAGFNSIQLCYVFFGFVLNQLISISTHQFLFIYQCNSLSFYYFKHTAKIFKPTI